MRVIREPLFGLNLLALLGKVLYICSCAIGLQLHYTMTTDKWTKEFHYD